MDDRTEQPRLEQRPRDAHLASERARPATPEEEGVASAHEAEQNRLLRALPLEEYARILPLLESERLHLKQVLVEPEVPIRDVYFVREGVISKDERVVCILTGHVLKDPDETVAYHSADPATSAKIIRRGVKSVSFANRAVPVPNDLDAIVTAIEQNT